MRIDLRNGYTVSVVKDAINHNGYSVAAWSTGSNDSHEFYKFRKGGQERVVWNIPELFKALKEIVEVEEPKCK